MSKRLGKKTAKNRAKNKAQIKANTKTKSKATKNKVAKTTSNLKYNIVICAHPDDETIFFGGLIQQDRSRPWLVAVATDGNADGMGAKRAADFQAACKKLGAAKTVSFGLPDVFENRLNLEVLKAKIAELPEAHAVYTHGPVGEYGHPHHQDVGYATHLFYNKKKPVYALAHNCLPDMQIKLTAKQFAVKAEVLSEIYGSETQRFQNILPCTSTEGFCRFDLKEIESLYRYYTSKRVPPASELKRMKWLLPFFELHKDDPIGPRPF